MHFGGRDDEYNPLAHSRLTFHVIRRIPITVPHTSLYLFSVFIPCAPYPFSRIIPLFDHIAASIVMDSSLYRLPDLVGVSTSLFWSKLFLVPALSIASAICTWKVLLRLNSRFSKQSLNNFESDGTWDWNKEIILITGGSSGIGAEMVRGFSKLGIRVIIWDVAAPPPDLIGKRS